MADEEQLKILKTGVKAWNEWRTKNAGEKPDLYYANLAGADLSNAKLNNANLVGANLSNAKLNTAELNSTDLSSADLSNAMLISAFLSGSNLFGANLSGAKLLIASLDGANLTRANLSRARFGGADLTGANLCAASLDWANLNHANLSDANLSSANLNRADLSGTNLYCTDFRGADLSNANLSSANLRGAKLDRCLLGDTTFGDNDLSEVEGLETIVHSSASTIGIDTFFRSRGIIPDAFLRGAGAPDIFIQYAASQAGTSFECHSCFVSYSAADEDLANRLHDDLQANGVRCWLAPDFRKIGGRFSVTFSGTVRFQDKLVLLLSEHSVKSEWVEREVESAFEKARKDERPFLFPVRLDDAVMKIEDGWADDIRRSRHIGDFTNWKDHDAYQKAFDRLLRDLKSKTIFTAPPGSKD